MSGLIMQPSLALFSIDLFMDKLIVQCFTTVSRTHVMK